MITLNIIQTSIENYFNDRVKITHSDLFGKNINVGVVGDADSGLEILPRIEMLLRTITSNRRKSGIHVQNNETYMAGNNHLEKLPKIPYMLRFGVKVHATNVEESNDIIWELLTNIPDSGVLLIEEALHSFTFEFITNQKIKDKSDQIFSEFIFEISVDIPQAGAYEKIPTIGENNLTTEEFLKVSEFND